MSEIANVEFESIGLAQCCNSVLKYARFFFWGTMFSAWGVVVAVSLLELYSSVSHMSFSAHFFAFLMATIAALIVGIPSGIVASPVWVLLRMTLSALNVGRQRSAMISAIPTLWVGVYAAVIMPEMLAGSRYGLPGLGPQILGVMAICTFVGPIVARKIYKDE